MGINWTGIFTSLTTKFTSTDSLDFTAFVANLEVQVVAGVSGLIVGGTIGESSALCSQEKEALVKLSVEKSEGRVPILLNIAEGSTNEAIRQAALAQHWGARGLMLLNPVGYSSDYRETLAFFRSIADTTTLPIIIASSAFADPQNLQVGILAELLELCPNIRALSDACNRPAHTQALAQQFSGRVKIFCSDDAFAHEALQLGAHGWVASVSGPFPRETVAMYRLIKSEQYREALQLYKWLTPLIQLSRHPKFVQIIKLAESLTGMGSEFVRAPRYMLDRSERETTLQLFRKILRARPMMQPLDAVLSLNEMISGN